MTPTPHNAAQKGDIAETVLMSGDPLRAKLIAERYLQDAVQYNDIRGMFGFTGLYKGKRVSVQGHGMGMPSLGIYVHELFYFYDVKNIIRVGTAGSISPDLKVKDIVIAQGACTDSNYASQFDLPGTYAPIASFTLLETAAAQARQLGLRFAVGNVLASDHFYGEEPSLMKKWRDMSVLAVEMESAALYMIAAQAGKNALCILTISDEIFTGAQATVLERQNAFTGMMEIALETALQI
ncbi:MAG: purine-nucleoside phosphorylase [Clostridiales bacterium]|nr:purine-nucleoside phosphorylase [Clostridiales bacterium]